MLRRSAESVRLTRFYSQMHPHLTVFSRSSTQRKPDICGSKCFSKHTFTNPTHSPLSAVPFDHYKNYQSSRVVLGQPDPTLQWILDEFQSKWSWFAIQTNPIESCQPFSSLIWAHPSYICIFAANPFKHPPKRCGGPGSVYELWNRPSVFL
jgi:hypothetical protein